MNNLIICTSPLQMLIADRIIEKFPNEKFDLLLISRIKNSKYRYYFNILGKKCDRNLFVGYHFLGIKEILGYTFTRFRLMIWLRKKYNHIFLASIDNSLIHNILSFTTFAGLYTFDDGTINISNNNAYKDSTYIRNSKLYPLLKRIFNIKYNIENIKYETRQHFTIYKSNNNIVSNTFYIPLLKNNIHNKNNETISILLGQKVFSSDEDNIKLIKNVVNKYKINFYFPHPKETYIIDNVKYIYTDLIFEDFISTFESRVILYTFFSSAALNVSEIDSVKIISLKPKTLIEPQYIDCYALFEENNIKIEILD